jgi:hypothetical protein
VEISRKAIKENTMKRLLAACVLAGMLIAPIEGIDVSGAITSAFAVAKSSEIKRKKDVRVKSYKKKSGERVKTYTRSKPVKK